MFVMVDSVKEVTVQKSCKYGQHRLFEHFLQEEAHGYFSVLKHANAEQKISAMLEGGLKDMLDRKKTEE